MTNRLDEEEYRGSEFKDWTCNVKGNNDMLSITQPHVISGIYKEYLESGSDLIGTNTFSSTTIAMGDYEMEDYAYELNYEGARLARQACDEVTAVDPTRPRFVVGAVGPSICSIICSFISALVDHMSTLTVNLYGVGINRSTVYCLPG